MGTNAGSMPYQFRGRRIPEASPGPVTQVQQRVGIESVEARFASKIREIGDMLRNEAGIVIDMTQHEGAITDVRLQAELKELLLDVAEVLRSLDTQFNERLTDAIRGEQLVMRRTFLFRRRR